MNEEELLAAMNLAPQPNASSYDLASIMQTMNPKATPKLSTETTVRQKVPLQNVGGPVMQIAAPKTAISADMFTELMKRQTQGLEQQRAGLGQFDEQLAQINASKPSQTTQVLSALSDMMNGGNQFQQAKAAEAQSRKQGMELQQNVQKYKNDLTDKEIDLIKAQFQNAGEQDKMAMMEKIARMKLAGEANKGPPEVKDYQALAAGFGRRMEQAEDVFSKLSNSGYDRTARGESLKGILPGELKGSDLVEQDQAERNFVNATLRKESGAAISPSEFKSSEQQYFPRPGDSPEVLANKQANRKQAVEMMKLGAGHAWNMIPKISPTVVPNAPKEGDTKEYNGVKYVVKGGNWVKK